MNFIKKIFSPIGATISYIQNHFKAMLFLLIVVLIIESTDDQDLTPTNLQIINLFGPIMEVSEVLNQIEIAQKDNKIRGVLLVVDSPGGAVAPSVEVAYAIKRLRVTKPVIAYAQGTCASGSYYASIWADKIIANPGSMVGSIGVIMQGFNLSEVMSKVGVKTQTVSAGRYKQVGTTDREWSKLEKAELNKVLKGTYDMFTKDVSDARELDYKKRDNYADAHIFTASQAKEVGLIDRVGVMYDAKKELIALAKVDKPVWSKENKFDKMMKRLTASTAILLHTYFPAIVLK